VIAPRRLLAAILLAMAVSVGAQTEHGYRVLEQRPQPRENFVQGLEIHDDVLLVGTGLNGQSRLRRYRWPEMTLIDEQRLHPRLFGEGVTRLGDRIYQLTWRSRVGLVFAEADLEPLQVFRIPGEGWGLTNDGESLIYSDGSHFLTWLDPETLQPTRRQPVTEAGRPVSRLNELEWINGRIWANVWATDDIVVIEPATGEVTARLHLQGLLPMAARRPDTDVMNGIAYDAASDAIWVTGKRWPYLYQIEPEPPIETAATDDPGAGATPESSR
jgi:glutamine cyclotransferase